MDFIKVAKVDNVRLRKNGEVYTGTLHLTAHHLIFNHPEEELWLPYPIIHTVERKPASLQTGLYPLVVRCRDFLLVTLSMPKEGDAADVFESVQKLTCVSSTEQLYAFFYTPVPPFPTNTGWSIYDPIQEYTRIGVGKLTDAWRFSLVNNRYVFSPSYPRVLVVPNKISDNVLTYAARYRSKARIPALSWIHPQNKASITRCSQPMVGLKQARSVQDEKLIEAIFQTTVSTTNGFVQYYPPGVSNIIVDARPTANAFAQTAMGAGTENMENYRNCKKIYMGIDNIHVMRDSLSKMCEAMQSSDVGGAVNQGGLIRSNWLKHISSVMEASVIIVETIHKKKAHVVVHCSDGWDRTSQLVALPEVCLDSFYRTFKGFQILIEKDWVSFGYKFADRCGHLSNEKFFVDSSQTNASGGAAIQKLKLGSNSHAKETSPVFHQFLDCVFQLIRQYPNRFEFSEQLLIDLHYHVYSCQFGTFLYNCERERMENAPDKKTHSVWDYFESKRATYLQEDYDPGLDAENPVLMPNSKQLIYWAGLFGRTDEEVNVANRDTSATATEQLPTQIESSRGEGNDEVDAGPLLTSTMKGFQSFLSSAASLFDDNPWQDSSTDHPATVRPMMDFARPIQEPQVGAPGLATRSSDGTSLPSFGQHFMGSLSRFTKDVGDAVYGRNQFNLPAHQRMRSGSGSMGARGEVNISQGMRELSIVSRDQTSRGDDQSSTSHHSDAPGQSSIDMKRSESSPTLLHQGLYPSSAEPAPTPPRAVVDQSHDSKPPILPTSTEQVMLPASPSRPLTSPTTSSPTTAQTMPLEDDQVTSSSTSTLPPLGGETITSFTTRATATRKPLRHSPKPSPQSSLSSLNSTPNNSRSNKKATMADLLDSPSDEKSNDLPHPLWVE